MTAIAAATAAVITKHQQQHKTPTHSHKGIQPLGSTAAADKNAIQDGMPTVPQ
jgi:hypothetical protein